MSEKCTASVLLVLLCVCNYISPIWSITDEEYAMMPPFYSIDDYDYCMKSDKALYCSIVFQLEPINDDNNSEVWELMEKIAKNEKFYRHDRLRHYVCVSRICNESTSFYYEENSTIFRENFAKCYSKQFERFQLKGSVVDYDCAEKGHRYPVSSLDITAAVLFGSVFALVLASTFYDLLVTNENENDTKKKHKSLSKTVFLFFSLRSSLQKLLSKPKKEHQEFLAFDGVRPVIMFCVILCHIAILKSSVPVANLDFVERELIDPLTLAFIHSTFVVVVYFAISGMVLGILFFDMIEKRPRLNVPYLIKGVFNRVLRILPALVFVVLFAATWMAHLFEGPFWGQMVGVEYQRCRENGWTNLVFINNVYKEQDMCLIQTWYLAADMQMFVMATALLGVIWKYPKYAVHVLTSAIVAATSATFALHYHQQSSIVIPRIIPENYEHTYLKERDWHLFYASPYANFGTYCISILFGYIYHKTRTVNVFRSKRSVCLWWAIIIGVPVALDAYGVLVNQPWYEHSRLEAALFVSLERNVFVASALVALYGYAKGQGSIVKTFLEAPFLQMLGRLTYSAFLVHYMVQRMRMGTVRYGNYMSMSGAFYECLGDFAASYLVGAVLFLFVEMPFCQIQKLIRTKFGGESNKNRVPEKSE